LEQGLQRADELSVPPLTQLANVHTVLDFRQAIKAMQEQIKKIEAKQASQQEQLAKLQARYQDHENKLDNHEDRLIAIERNHAWILSQSRNQSSANSNNQQNSEEQNTNQSSNSAQPSHNGPGPANNLTNS
jgi:septal ring factor EnvC (AmiA/AmiB activator)